MSVFELFISAIFVNNIVLAQYLGNCPYLGCSRDKGVAVGMGSAVIFVIFMATLCTWLMQRYVLVPFELGYLQTIVFILVIAGFGAVCGNVPQEGYPAAVFRARHFPAAHHHQLCGDGRDHPRAARGVRPDHLAALRGGVEPRLHARAHPHGGHPRTAGHLPCAPRHSWEPPSR